MRYNTSFLIRAQILNADWISARITPATLSVNPTLAIAHARTSSVLNAVPLPGKSPYQNICRCTQKPDSKLRAKNAGVIPRSSAGQAGLCSARLTNP
jgi:hypothetical protein